MKLLNDFLLRVLMGDLIFTILQGFVDIFTFESSHFSFLYIVASVGRQNSVGIDQPVVGLIVKQPFLL